MSIRQKFEEWAGDQGFCLTRTFDEDGYQDLRTQGPWDAWQAAFMSSDGYVLVPVELTEAMVKAVYPLHYFTYLAPELRENWARMLAARPGVK